MHTTSTKAALAAALLGGSVSAWALGLGPARVTAVLGQPLNAAVPLHMEGQEPWALDCFDVKVLFGEGLLVGDQVRLQIDTSASKPGEGLLRISTLPVVNEPLVTFTVSARCGGTRIVREFVAFADPPPEVSQRQPLSFAPLASTRDAPAPAPAAPRPRRTPSGEVVPPSAEARRPSPIEARAEAQPERVVPKRVVQAPVHPDARLRPEPEPAPQLRLEPLPVPPVAAIQLPKVEAAADAGATAPPAMPAAVETIRLQALEASLVAMRSEMAQTRRMLEALEGQQRRKEESASAPQDSLLYLLGGLAAALAAAVGWLLLERRRERAVAGWDHGWVEPPLQGEGFSAGGAATDLGGAPEGRDPPPISLARVSSTEAQPAVALEAEGAAATGIGEDLSDLDQQIAFLVALGQDRAAISLLQSHLEQRAGASPLPWLELLALYQRENLPQDFESTAARFSARFSTSAPAWEVDVRQGCGLEDFPDLIERIESKWRHPDEAAAVLEALLLQVRREGGMLALPACQDLLLLYGIVRERRDSDDFVELPLEPQADLSTPDLAQSLGALPPLEASEEFVELPLIPELEPTGNSQPGREPEGQGLVFDSLPPLPTVPEPDPAETSPATPVAASGSAGVDFLPGRPERDVLDLEPLEFRPPEAAGSGSGR